jgi:hypothetical protein
MASHCKESDRAMTRRKMVWHYTVGEKLKLITAARYLRPTDGYVDKDERPALWFSRRDSYEPVACKDIVRGRVRTSLNVEETHRLGGGLIRFGLPADDERLHDWRRFKIESGITQRTARRLERTARRKGSYSAQWSVSYDPIPLEDLTLERYDLESGTWEAVTE